MLYINAYLVKAKKTLIVWLAVKVNQSMRKLIKDFLNSTGEAANSWLVFVYEQ